MHSSHLFRTSKRLSKSKGYAGDTETVTFQPPTRQKVAILLVLKVKDEQTIPQQAIIQVIQQYNLDYCIFTTAEAANAHQAELRKVMLGACCVGLLSDLPQILDEANAKELKKSIRIDLQKFQKAVGLKTGIFCPVDGETYHNTVMAAGFLRSVGFENFFYTPADEGTRRAHILGLMYMYPTTFRGVGTPNDAEAIVQQVISDDLDTIILSLDLACVNELNLFLGSIIHRMAELDLECVTLRHLREPGS
jgi:hypothetical protein